MKNKLVNVLFYLPIIVLAAVMAYYNYAAGFKRVTVAVEGYDPKDFFSGYYMNLQINWEKTDCTQFAENICPRDEFLQHYRYFINQAQSEELTAAVNANKAKLVFSYAKGHTPYIVELLIDDKVYRQNR